MNKTKHRVAGGEIVRVAAGGRYNEPLLLDPPGRHVRLELAAGAKADVVFFCSGGTHSIEVVLAGENAEIDLWGLYMVGGSDRADISVRVEHATSDCRSRQLIKGIAGGSAVGSFTGMIHVAPGAQRTDASLQNNNLQLTDTARLLARPQLEIYADDVKCGHGATVGQLDREAIYYMRQRGVGENEARRMQLRGFADDIINRCSSANFRELATARIDDSMEIL